MNIATRREDNDEAHRRHMAVVSAPADVRLALALEPSGVTTVENQVRAYIDGCVEGTQPSPAGCPAGAGWRIDVHPAVDVQLAAGGEVTVTTRTPGRASSPTGATTAVRVSGTASVDGGRIVFRPS